jgi:hypothetical protein
MISDAYRITLQSDQGQVRHPYPPLNSLEKPPDKLTRHLHILPKTVLLDAHST